MVIEEIQSEETLTNLDKFSSLILEHDLVGEAKSLMIAINRIFRKNKLFFKNHPGLFRSYNKYLLRVQLVVLFDLYICVYSVYGLCGMCVYSALLYKRYTRIRLIYKCKY